jgi:zinc protease
MKKLISTIIILFLFINFSFLYPQNKELPLDKDVTIGTLENGIKYYIKKNQKPEKRAELYLIVSAGSVLENEKQLGLAHFVEHMAFNGTKNFKKNELINYLESIGIKFGPELNAYTSFDQTVYMLTVPTDSLEILTKGFLVLEDWAHNQAFDPIEIDKERGVIVEEWRLGRGAQMRMLDKQLPILFKDSRYAERLPIGKKEIIESFDHQTLIDFYKNWYRPDLIAVAAVGDFDVKEIEGYIKNHFEKIPYPEQIMQKELFPIPKHEETYFAIASDKEAIYSTIAVYYKRNPQVVKSLDDYKNELIHQLFYAMLNDRLTELTTMGDPPFSYAYTGNSKFVKSSDVSFLVGVVKEGGIEKGFDALLTEAERVKDHGFTATELERQKANQLRMIEKRRDEKDKTESRELMQEFVDNYLYDEPILGIENMYELYNQLIPLITLEDVNKISAELISHENRVVMIAMPEKEGIEIPNETELAKIIDEVSREKIEAYVDKVQVKPLVDVIPNPTPVVESKQIEELGITEWKLGNGVKVIIKPTDYKNDEIVFSAFSPGGSSLISDLDFLSADNASSFIYESGLGSFSRTELDKYLSGKIVNVNPYIGYYDEGLNGSTSPKDLETFFQLIYSYFTQPKIDSTAFLSLKSKMKSYLENMSNEPAVAFRDTLDVTLANYHFRNRPFTVKMLDEIDMNKSISIYKNRFADASDFTFVFAGNIDLSTFKPLVETYLGGLPSLNRNEKPIDLKYTNIKGEINKVVHKGIEQKSSVAIAYVGDMKWSRKNEHTMESLMDVLNIKLREAIREEKGGTYGIQAYHQIYRIPESHYSININFGCNPDRVDELVATVFQVIDSIKTFGPDNTVMTKIKEIQKRQRELNLKKNNFWKGVVSNYIQYNEDPIELLSYNNWVDEITAEDIKQAANQYLNKNVVKVVLYPEAKP